METDLKLCMQFTYKDTTISMLRIPKRKTSTTTKNMVVLYHAEKTPWEDVNLKQKNIPIYTSKQATKRFGVLINGLIKSNINIKQEKNGL